MRSVPRIALVLMLFVFAGYATTTYLRRIAEVGARQGPIPRTVLSIGAVLGDPGENEDAPGPAIPDQTPLATQKPEAPNAGAAQRQAATTIGLSPHPDPNLVERSDLGLLPIVAEDGRRPWQVYARPFSRRDERPRIAIVMTGLGVSRNATQSVINTLPGAVTLSFAPYADNLDRWIRSSRSKGHEVLIDMPMEPLDYPRNDPGPNTLLAHASTDQNLRRLAWALSRTTGYVGVATFMGANLAARPAALKPVLTELRLRGLLILDTRETPPSHIAEIADKIGLPFAVNDIFVDREPTAEAIEERLRALEARARDKRTAIALARPLPITIRTLIRWLPDLEDRGIVLAPVSALVQTREKGT